MFLPNKAKFSSYYRLLRLGQPAGIWLVMWPGLWSLGLASPNFPSLKLLLVFIVGSIVMRGAGCIINDIFDRDFDKYVERTATRPIASGEVSVREALLILFILLLLALCLLLQLNLTTKILGLVSLMPIIIYPLMKRITYWPQAFLGFTFNFAALMGWSAVRDELGLPAIFLYIACIFWTLAYDTIYAHQDKKDDILIGVKSTALKLKNRTKFWVKIFYWGFLAFLAISFYLAGLHPISYLSFLAMIIYIYLQIRGWDEDNPKDCMIKFKSNIVIGWVVFISIIVSKCIF